MNNTIPLEQTSKTGSLDSNLRTRQYKLDLLARFMEMKAMNPRLTQKGIAKDLAYSTSSLHRYRHDINMLSPEKNPRNSHERNQKILNRELDDERPQFT